MRLTEFEKNRLISAADKVVTEEAVRFDAELPGILTRLIASVKACDVGATKEQSYHLKGTAGGFGWPMVGQAAGYLHLAMEKGQTSREMFQVSALFIEKIQLLVQENNRGETPEGVTILKTMYNQLEQQGLLD